MSSQHPTTKSNTSSSAPATQNSESKDFSQNKDKEDQAHATDSGFLSGPQSSFCDDQEEQKQRFAENKSNENNFNKPPSSSHDTKKNKEAPCVVDSGCIEEYEEDDDSNALYAKVQRKSITQQQQGHQHTTTATTDGFNIKSSNNTNERLQQQDVDAHMTERFSNLSLQKNDTINNLNASSRVANTESVTTAATTKTTESNQLPAWEQCYQQNDDGDTYLHLACISGHENVVAALIRLAIHPCLLSIKNDYGQTPLHLAALTKQRRILRMLLLAGAEPSIRDRHGNTALHLACMSGDEQCVNALTMPFSASEINEAHRQYGYRSNDKLVSSLSYACLPPDLEIRNYNGEFCVHIAAEAGHINILSILAQYGADINAREGKGGYTPLHIAIEKGNEELFKFLIDECKHKLNLETTTFGRLTAYQFACILKRSKMQSFLEKRGAEPLTPPDSEYDDSSDDESDFEESQNYDRFVDASYFNNYKGGNAMAVM